MNRNANSFVFSSFALALMLVAFVALPQGSVLAEGMDDFAIDWGSSNGGYNEGGFEGAYGGGFEGAYGGDGPDYSGAYGGDGPDYSGDSAWGDDYGYKDEMYTDDYYYEDDYYYDDYGYSGGSYGGGYSSGGGSSFYPKSGYPTTIYAPKPTPSTPSNSTNTNNNTNVNINNNTAIAVAQVQIGSQQTSYQQPAPYCSIYQAQYGSGYGNQVYLSWTSTNASSAYLSGYGSVGTNGSQTVYTSGNQIYTLTVYGYNGQQATCQTTVHTATPYVSLTQIPYTGFDFGPFGNAMYWAGMIVFALAGAYLAVYFIPGFAFATGKRAYAPIVAPKAPILVEKEAAVAKVAPIIASLKKAGTNDAMAIVKSNDGSMPKIVIDRS